MNIGTIKKCPQFLGLFRVDLRNSALRVSETRIFQKNKRTIKTSTVNAGFTENMKEIGRPWVSHLTRREIVKRKLLAE